MEIPKDLDYLKHLLTVELNKIVDSIREYEDLSLNISLLNELITILNMDEEEILNHKLSFFLIANNLVKTDFIPFMNEFHDNLMLLVRYKNLRFKFMDEYELISNNFSIIKNKLADYLNDELKKAMIKHASINIESVKKRYLQIDRIIKKFEFDQTIDNDETNILVECMDNYNVTDKDQIRILEKVNNYNSDLHSKRSEDLKMTEEEKVSLLDFLDIGFDDYEEEVEYSDLSDARERVIPIFELIKQLKDKNEIMDIVESYKNEFKDEYSAFLAVLVTECSLDISKTREYICDKDFYMDEESKQAILDELKHKLGVYLSLRENLVEKLKPVDEEVEKVKNILLFSKSRTFRDLTDIEEDLEDKSIPLDMYKDAYEALTRFKYGKDEKQSFTNDKHKVFDELKYKRVRVFVKHLKGNMYSILGVCLKTQNVETQWYKRMDTREENDISTEENLKRELSIQKEIEERILGKLNGKRGRKNS